MTFDQKKGNPTPVLHRSLRNLISRWTFFRSWSLSLGWCRWKMEEPRKTGFYSGLSDFISWWLIIIHSMGEIFQCAPDTHVHTRTHVRMCACTDTHTHSCHSLTFTHSGTQEDIGTCVKVSLSLSLSHSHSHSITLSHWSFLSPHFIFLPSDTKPILTLNPTRHKFIRLEVIDSSIDWPTSFELKSGKFR